MRHLTLGTDNVARKNFLIRHILIEPAVDTESVATDLDEMNWWMQSGVSGFEYILAETGERFYWGRERALRFGTVIDLGWGRQVALPLGTADKAQHWQQLLKEHKAGRLRRDELAVEVLRGNFYPHGDDLLEFLSTIGFLTNVPYLPEPLEWIYVRLYRGTHGFYPKGVSWTDSFNAARSYVELRKHEDVGKQWWWQVPHKPDGYVFMSHVEPAAIRAIVNWGRYREYVVDPSLLGEIRIEWTSDRGGRVLDNA